MSLLSMQKTHFANFQCIAKFQQQGHNTYHDLPKKSDKKSATLNESCIKCLELEKRVARDEKVAMECMQELLRLRALLLLHENQLSLLEKTFAAVGRLCISHEDILPALEYKYFQLTKLLGKLTLDFNGMWSGVHCLKKSNEDATNSINSLVNKNKEFCTRINSMKGSINTLNDQFIILCVISLGFIVFQQYQIYVLRSMLKV